MRQHPVFLLQLKMAEYERLLLAQSEAVTSLEDPRVLGRYYASLGHCQWVFGRCDEAIPTLQQATTLCEATHSHDASAYAFAIMQWTRLHKGDLREVTELEPFVMRALDHAPDNRIKMWALTASVLALANRGRWQQAIEKADEAIRIFEALADTSLLSQSYWSLANVYILMGAKELGVNWARRAYDIAPTPGDRAWAQVTEGWALAQLEPERAITILASWIDVFVPLNIRSSEVWLRLGLAEAYRQARQPQAAFAQIEKAILASEECAMNYWLAAAHRLAAEVMMSQEAWEPITVGRHLEAAIELAKRCDAQNELARSLAQLARLDITRADRTSARANFERALEILERLGTLEQPERVRAELEALP